MPPTISPIRCSDCGAPTAANQRCGHPENRDGGGYGYDPHAPRDPWKTDLRAAQREWTEIREQLEAEGHPSVELELRARAGDR